MTQPELNESQVETGFQQMRRPGMAQSVNRSEFVDATVFESGAESVLHTALRPGLSCLRQLDVVTPFGRKEPEGVAVALPIVAQVFEGALRQRHEAVFVAFAMSDVKHQARAIDIGNLKPYALLESQTAGVDGGQTDAVARQTDGAENLSDFLLTEDDGKFLLGFRAHEIENRPLAIESKLEEELDGAKGDGDSRARPFLDIDDVEKVVSEFIFRDQVWGFVKVLGELPDSANVGLLSAFGESPELQRFDHSLTQFSHNDTS